MASMPSLGGAVPSNIVQSSRLTYSLSAFVALSRLHFLDAGLRSLELHIIGADWKEGRTVEASVEVGNCIAESPGTDHVSKTRV